MKTTLTLQEVYRNVSRKNSLPVKPSKLSICGAIENRPEYSGLPLILQKNAISLKYAPGMGCYDDYRPVKESNSF